MNDMTYKGYTTKIEYSAEDSCLIGHILGIQGVIGFHGDSVEEVRHAFEEAVDDYLATCAQVGKEPQKPFSGRLMLRLPPELHAKWALQAKIEGKSLNSLLVEALSQAEAR